MDVISVLKDIKEKYSSSFDEETIKKIDESINNPELRLSAQNGELVAYASNFDGEYVQAGVCLENSEGTLDLCMAESMAKNKLCEDRTTGEEYELNPGDIKILIWGDVYSEDYTGRFVLKDEEIKEAFNIECDEDIEKE